MALCNFLNKGCSGSDTFVYYMHTLLCVKITTRLYIEEPQYIISEKLKMVLNEMKMSLQSKCTRRWYLGLFRQNHDGAIWTPVYLNNITVTSDFSKPFLDALLHLETQIQMCVHKVIAGNIVAFCLNCMEKLVQIASCWASTP